MTTTTATSSTLGARSSRWVSWCGPVEAVLAFSVVVSVTGSIGLALGLAGVAFCSGRVVPIDLREHRIPNAWVLAALASALAGIVSASMLGEASLPAALGDAAWGVVLSGAVGLAVIWIVAPRLIGGGDVKLLAVVGAALGSIDPRAALVAGGTAALVQLLASTGTGRRVLPFAPALDVGLLVGVLSTWWLVGGGGVR